MPLEGRKGAVDSEMYFRHEKEINQRMRNVLDGLGAGMDGGSF